MIGTLLGGTVGLGLMSNKGMANNPFELGVLLCICAFATGCLGSTKFKHTASGACRGGSRAATPAHVYIPIARFATIEAWPAPQSTSRQRRHLC